VTEIAAKERTKASYASRVPRLALEIVESILDGRHGSIAFK